MSDEIAKLIPQENELTLSNGEKITIKTLSWGKEIKVLQIVSKFFDENKLLEVLIVYLQKMIHLILMQFQNCFYH